MPSIDSANDLIYQVIHYSETFFSYKPKKHVSSIYAITSFIEQFIILKHLLPGKKLFYSSKRITSIVILLSKKDRKIREKNTTGFQRAKVKHFFTKMIPELSLATSNISIIVSSRYKLVIVNNCLRERIKTNYSYH